MPVTLTDANSFDDVTAPSASDVRNAASVQSAMQTVANRTRFLKNSVDAEVVSRAKADALRAPGLRLTLVSGSPAPEGDALSGATLFYTPFLNGEIGLYDGSAWAEYSTSEVSVALSVTSGKNYDVFAYWNGSAVALELSAPWTSDTARADGLTRQDGVLVKSAAPTRRYLGTLRGFGSGAVDSYQNRFLWNYYNRVRRPIRRYTSTTSWTYSGALRQAGGDANNFVAYVCGDDAGIIEIVAQGMVNYTADNWGAGVDIGLDSTTVGSAQLKSGAYTIRSAANAWSWPRAEYKGPAQLGYHVVNWLEQAAALVTFGGTNGDASYFQSGMLGTIEG